MPNKPTGTLLAALQGVVIAIIIAYVISFAGVVSGVANITSPGVKHAFSKAAAMQAGLNLYAMQHVTLAGSGTKVDVFGDSQQISDSITLPLTIWVIIPAVALMIGGYLIGKRRMGTGNWGVASSVILAAVVYTLAFIAASHYIGGKLSPSVLPAVGGTEYNPHDIILRPNVISTAISAGLISLIFIWIGSLISLREQRRLRVRSQWWVCCKAVILVAVLMQLAFTAVFGWWLFWKAPGTLLDGSARWKVFTMSPTAAGMVYSMLHGVSLSGEVQSPMQSEESMPSGKISVKDGIKVTGKPAKPFKPTIVIAVISIMALAAFLAGALSVRWGSRGGAILTALRNLVMQAALLGFLVVFCNLGWSSQEGPAQYTLSIGLHLGAMSCLWLLGFFISSFLGAYMTNRWYAGRHGFPYAHDN